MRVRPRRHKAPWRLQQFLQLLALFDNTLMDVFPFDIGKLWMTAASQLDDGMSVPLAPKDAHNDSNR